MSQNQVERLTIGIDLGDRVSHYCVINDQGVVLEEGRMRTLQESVRRWAQAFSGARMVIEAGTHSAWMSRLLQELGHEVIVGNAREIAALRRTNKNDRRDAERLARYGRIDPALLAPIAHRSEELQLDLAVIKVRERLVSVRAVMINTVKGLMKSFGFHPPAGCPDVFAKRCPEVIGKQLLSIVQPLLEQIAALTLAIKASDCSVEEIAEQRYPETRLMRSIFGVGPLTALCFRLTVGDPGRFRRSRDAGCFVGLRPKQFQSGDRDPQLGISKVGSKYLRNLLVQCAHHVLGPFGKDSALRQWGLRLSERGGKNASKRAITAVARKLAVLMHRVWVTKKIYTPFPKPMAL